jgi:hypothetical protein
MGMEQKNLNMADSKKPEIFKTANSQKKIRKNFMDWSLD